MTQELARALRRHHGAPLPHRYFSFIAQEQYEELEYLHLQSGFVEGWFLPSFAEYRKLRDVELMARHAGVDGLSAWTWATEFRDFMPFASLEPAHEGERQQDIGAFLVIGTGLVECPVYVLVREGLMLIPLAPSITSFMRGHPWREAPAEAHRRLGRPYDAFGWSRAPAPQRYPRLLNASR